MGIPKSTLSYWFNYLSWSREIKDQNSEKIKEISTKRIILMNEVRRKQAQKEHTKMKEEAEVEFEIYKDNPVFIGSLMLYLGEGDKSKYSQIRISNVDPSVLRIFARFLIKFCKIKTERIKFWMLCYPDHNIEKCLNWWSVSTGINRSQFYKTQVIQGKHKEKKLLYGVGNITISSILLKTKILRWIEIMSEYLMRV